MPGWENRPERDSIPSPIEAWRRVGRAETFIGSNRAEPIQAKQLVSNGYRESRRESGDLVLSFDAASKHRPVARLYEGRGLVPRWSSGTKATRESAPRIHSRKLLVHPTLKACVNKVLRPRERIDRLVTTLHVASYAFYINDNQGDAIRQHGSHCLMRIMTFVLPSQWSQISISFSLPKATNADASLWKQFQGLLHGYRLISS